MKAIEAQHGIFVERAKGIYSFSHLTFQEYFTAKYIVDNPNKRGLETLVRTRITEDSWREVFLITTGMLDDADDFLQSIKKRIDSFVTNPRIASLLKVVFETAEKPDGLDSLLLNNENGAGYNRALVLSFTLLLAREYLLILERIGRLPKNYPSSHVRSPNNDLNMSFAYSRDLLGDLSKKKSASSDEILRKAREYIVPLSSNYQNDPVIHNLLDTARKRFPVLNVAFNLATVELDLSELTRFLITSDLLVRCLQSECYVSKDTRQFLLDTLLIVK